MKFCKLFFFVIVSVMVVMMMSAEVKSQPQRNSQRGRAVSGFNRGNDVDDDYDDQEEDNAPPRKYGRRGYRSNCRCARISNCPKLQITIPRCPPEEFVCCFN